MNEAINLTGIRGDPMGSMDGEPAQRDPEARFFRNFNPLPAVVRGCVYGCSFLCVYYVSHPTPIRIGLWNHFSRTTESRRAFLPHGWNVERSIHPETWVSFRRTFLRAIPFDFFFLFFLSAINKSRHTARSEFKDPDMVDLSLQSVLSEFDKLVLFILIFFQ